MIYTINEGKVLIGDEFNSILTEDSGKLQRVPDIRVPKDFPKTIVSIMTKIEENTGRKIGQGPIGAGLAVYKIFPNNAKEKVLNNPPKSYYTIIVPLKRLFLNSISEADRINDIIERSIVPLGYSKCGSIADGWRSFYKKGQNKTIYLLGSVKIYNNQIQVQNWCIEDNEYNNEYIKGYHNITSFSKLKNESTNIFSSIELL